MQQSHFVKFLWDSALYLGLDPAAAVSRACGFDEADIAAGDADDEAAPWLCRQSAYHCKPIDQYEGLS